MKSRQQLPDLIDQCQQFLQQGQPREVLQLLGPWLEAYPQEPALLHLAGVASRTLGNYDSAVMFFSEALKYVPDNADIHNSLANALKSLNRFDEAERHYFEALTLKPKYFAAMRNLSLLMIDTERFDDAIKLLQSALSESPGNIELLTALGAAFRSCERYTKAIETYQQVLSLQPSHLKALHNTGLSYKLNGHAETAIEYFKRASRVEPKNAKILFDLGGAQLDAQNYEEAIVSLEASLQMEPANPLTHSTLNEVHWQMNNNEAFGQSYRKAIAAYPQDLALKLSYIDQLLTSKSLELASEMIGQTRAQFGESAFLLRAEARVHSTNKHFDRAAACLEVAAEKLPDNYTFLELASANISLSNYSSAMRALDRSFDIEPTNQLLWAYRSTCWRLTGDDRYAWLNDYEKFVQAYMLPVPEGYDDLSHFMSRLSKTLANLHRTRREPLAQSLKGGTQTPGRLLHLQDPVIKALRNSLSQSVTTYMNTLPNDAQHPLLSRNTGRFLFSGSWSVRLKPNGFHVNHVHPQGWISSSFYVDLPSSMNDSDEAGCIKFGESGIDLGDREVVEKVIRPKVGQLVLFPSYTWHGTFPFHADNENEVRTTAPFDVMPVTP